MFTPTIECIFIHVPKTAGLNVYENILNLYRPFGWFLGASTTKEHYLYEIKEGASYLGHISYKEALKSKVIDRNYWKRSFKFTFVRNPYDRMVSLYEYHRVHKLLKMDFDTFIDKLYNTKIPSVGLYNVKTFDKRTSLYCPSIFGNQYNPMVDWIPDDIGFIGRMENFNDDMNKLLVILGYEGEPQDFKPTNVSKHGDYREYYTNPKTIEYVNEMYNVDFKRFGYKKMESSKIE